MRTQSTIFTETDYLRAHLTIIDLQPRGAKLTLRDVKQRATSMLEKWILAANARSEEIAGGIQKLMLVTKPRALRP
jgi:hypothetical protein